MSQKALAERSGASQQGIANWETGNRIPAFNHALALCKALGVSCMTFVDCEFEEVPGRRGRGRPPVEDKPKRRKKG